MALKIPPCVLCGMEALSMTLLDDKYWICSAHLKGDEPASCCGLWNCRDCRP